MSRVYGSKVKQPVKINCSSPQKGNESTGKLSGWCFLTVDEKTVTFEPFSRIFASCRFVGSMVVLWRRQFQGRYAVNVDW